MNFISGGTVEYAGGREQGVQYAGGREHRPTLFPPRGSVDGFSPGTEHDVSPRVRSGARLDLSSKKSTGALNPPLIYS